MKRIIVYGATSAIAQATARLWAERGDALFLVGRDQGRLSAVADDLRTRGASRVDTFEQDLNDTERHQESLRAAIESLGGLDTALVAHGVLGDQKEAEQSWEKTRAVLETNFMSAASLLTHLAEYFERQKTGCIGVISSVAGDRGRQSNYVYGASKAAKTIFLQGLRNRLYKADVGVVTIKPGFVDTPMTSHLPKNPLFASPEKIAVGIVRAIDKRKDVAYLPWFWWPIMCIVRHVPERIFKRLSL